MAYCFSIRSKKNFFKAVSNALKFNDKNLDLWLLAVYYEFEVNRSPFKARTIFHTALQVNGKDMDFWEAYFLFEIKFLDVIHKRRALLTESECAIEEEVVDDINKEFLSFETKKITNQFNLNIKQSLEKEENM